MINGTKRPKRNTDSVGDLLGIDFRLSATADLGSELRLGRQSAGQLQMRRGNLSPRYTMEWDSLAMLRAQ